MGISTIFANVSCRDWRQASRGTRNCLAARRVGIRCRALRSGISPTVRRVQLYEQREHAGHSTLTLGVLPLEPERGRLVDAGLDPGPIEEADDYFIMRIRDPDQNLVVFASAKRD